jgi:acyl-homoserine lactone acylase PvdQ
LKTSKKEENPLFIFDVNGVPHLCYQLRQDAMVVWVMCMHKTLQMELMRRIVHSGRLSEIFGSVALKTINSLLD